MIALVIGAKGGVGTTTVALELARRGSAVAVDLADGQFAARLERATWSLATLGFGTASQQREAVELIVKRGPALMWTPECHLAIEAVQAGLRAIGVRRPVVMDGGLEPQPGLAALADAVVIITADSDLARWHEQHLRQRYPQAQSSLGTREAARELAAQLFNLNR